MYSFEQKAEAQDYYVTEGLTYDEVSEETGISVSQLKEWGRELGWFDLRAEYQRNELRKKAAIKRAEANLAEKIEQDGNPQSIFALSHLLRVPRQGAMSRGKIVQSVIAGLLDFALQKFPDRFDVVGDTVLLFLEEADPELLQLKRWQLTQLREKVESALGSARSVGVKKNLDPDTLRKIREEVYGIVDARA